MHRDPQLRVLRQLYLPGQSAPLAVGALFRAPAALAAELVAKGSAQMVEPPAPAPAPAGQG